VYPLLRALLLLVVCMVFIAPVIAQGEPEVINAGNIEHFASDRRIDFDTMPSDLGGVDLGWFALSRDRLAIRGRDNELVILNMQGNIIDRYSVPGRDELPATLLDADFNATGDTLASVHLDGMGYVVAYREIELGSLHYFRFETTDSPIRIWVDEQVWLEISPYDPHQGRYVVQLLPSVFETYQPGAALEGDEVRSVLSGPENDPDAFLRVERIKPPVAITVTQAGLLKRWNLETGEATATAQLNVLPGAGQVNASGSHFVWRDQESSELYLLNFETGENRLITSLNETYVPFLFLSPSADVALGVNVGLEPIIVAWDMETGERYNLGEYRMCNRQPDMVRMSSDGTAMVIGCDTGLDIWRIV
jgi:hypothetical protein